VAKALEDPVVPVDGFAVNVAVAHPGMAVTAMTFVVAEIKVVAAAGTEKPEAVLKQKAAVCAVVPGPPTGPVAEYNVVAG